MKKTLCWLLLLLLAGAVVSGFDNRLTLTEYTVSNGRIPPAFDGYRIAVISDLHAKTFGEQQQTLISLVQDTACDLICLPGDLVSSQTTDFAPVWAFIDAMAGTPMVYTAGNNELSLPDYDGFLKALESRGVTVLDDIEQRTLALQRGDDVLLLHGHPFTDSRHISNQLPVAPEGFYNILLYHDPYCFDEAALLDYDLMISGHIHGGVIRLPGLGSPLEWLAIEPFTKGVYTARAATLVLSGGLGGHETLPRFFNPPEVVLITLDAFNQ